MISSKRAPRALNRAIVAGSAMALTLGLGAPNALAHNARPHAIYCNGGDYYKVSTVSNSYFLGIGIVFTGGPGGHITAQTQYSLTVGATFSGNIEYSGSAIITAAKVSAGVSLSASASISQSWQYDHDVHANMMGHMRFGNYGTAILWSKWHEYTNCTDVELGSGTGHIPDNGGWGYLYWETAPV